jgi:hypothetical protein
MTRRLLHGLGAIAVTLAAVYALMLWAPFLGALLSGGQVTDASGLVLPAVTLVLAAAAVACRGAIARWIAADAEDVEASPAPVAFIAVKIVGFLTLFAAVGDAALLVQSRWRTPQMVAFAIAFSLAVAFLTWTGPIANAIVEHRGADEPPAPSTMAIVFAGIGVYELASALPALARTLVSIPAMQRFSFGWNPAGDLAREIVQIAVAAALILYARALARKLD